MEGNIEAVVVARVLAVVGKKDAQGTVLQEGIDVEQAAAVSSNDSHPVELRYQAVAVLEAVGRA